MGDNSYLSPQEHTDARHANDQSFDFTRSDRGRAAADKSYLVHVRPVRTIK